MRTTRPICLASILVTCASQLMAQTVWSKYAGNPVLDLGPPGAWDDTRVVPDTVILENGTYRLWYTGWDGSPDGNFQIGYATSPNGINWTREPSNPVLETGDPGAWDAYGAGHAQVLKDGGLYKMWYSGSSGDGSIVGVGYAESVDGIQWTKHGGNPVLQQGSPGEWDSWGANWCSVIEDDTASPDERYKMWYSGGQSYTSHRIGYATSSDGINWVKYSGNPVLGTEHSGSWDDLQVWFPHVMKDGATYRMWYAGHDGSNGRSGYASSQDGIVWQVYECNPVLDLGASGEWDEQSVGIGCVLRLGTRWKMWYTGSEGPDGEVKRMGYAMNPDSSGDLDADGDVDMGDFALFQQQFTGPQP